MKVTAGKLVIAAYLAIAIAEVLTLILTRHDQVMCVAHGIIYMCKK
jgi:hypothetical protein